MSAIELVVTPPAIAPSAEEALASALLKQRLALEEPELTDRAAAQARDDVSREPVAHMRRLEAQIQAVTLPDDVFDLAGGMEALTLWVSGDPLAIRDVRAPSARPVQQHFVRTPSRRNALAFIDLALCFR
jgi:hypothetical protein